MNLFAAVSCLLSVFLGCSRCISVVLGDLVYRLYRTPGILPVHNLLCVPGSLLPTDSRCANGISDIPSYHGYSRPG